MAATSQQPVSVMVCGGTQQPPTVIQTVSQPMVPMPVRRGDKLPHRRSHYILGILQMVVGCLCFCLSVLGFMVGTGNMDKSTERNGIYYRNSYTYFGTGIYAGIFFFIPGFLGFMAYKHNSTCCVVGCMVMNIIGTCVAIIGLSFASIEISVNSYISTTNSNLTFQSVKRGIVLAACIFEMVVTIVHAAFTCASCCDCCLPRQPVPAAPQVSGAVVVHQVPQSNVMYPGQVYTPYQGSVPQQQIVQQPMLGGQYPGQSYQVVQNYPQQPVQSYPTQQPVQNYPPQQFSQGVNPQHPLNPPPYNPTFAHSSPPGENPPPYTDFPSSK